MPTINYPLRTTEHITDTLALRIVMRHLSEDFLVRSVEERDYGIDLQLELFDGKHPTGGMAMVQVKGTRANFKLKNPKLLFPVKTIEYSLLFNVPFFVFYVSIASEKIFSIHIQKYIDTKLEGYDGKWRTNKKVTFEFPEENEITSNVSIFHGQNKIKEIIKFNNIHPVAMQLMEIDHHLKRFGKLALEDIAYNSDSCIKYSKMLVHTNDFFEGRTVFGQTDLNSMANELCQMFEDRFFDVEKSKVYIKRLGEIIEMLDTPIFEYFMKNSNDCAAVKLNENSKNHFPEIPY